MPAGNVIPNFFHFKPPYNIKEQNNETLKQHQKINGLDWSAGGMPYTCL